MRRLLKMVTRHTKGGEVMDKILAWHFIKGTTLRDGQIAEVGKTSDPSRQSTLASYRSRQSKREEPISVQPSDATPSKSEPPRQKARGKWWLRRMPNRFRSISHRDFQDTPTSGYNNKHN